MYSARIVLFGQKNLYGRGAADRSVKMLGSGGQCGKARLKSKLALGSLERSQLGERI